MDNIDTADYNVYALVDGVAYDEESFSDITDAYAAFDALTASYKADAKLALLGGDAAIHLYDPFYGSMVAETYIPQHAS